MIFAIRNFKRNKMVNLTARSIKHFLPDSKIFCFTFGDNDQNQEPLLDYITEIKNQTKYVNTGRNSHIHDHVDSSLTSGYANPMNGLFFSEGYNVIFEYFKNLDEPVIILSEDHFFTTGKVLSELVNADFDVAYASGDREDNANGAILGIVPYRLYTVFPIKEEYIAIEPLIKNYILDKVPHDRKYKIINRRWIDYCGDGIYTNSSEEMINEMKKAGII